MATAGTAINKRAEHSADIDNLPVLFTRLGDDVMQLFDAKMSLLKVEVGEEVSAFLRGGVVIAIAALVALIGLALASVAASLGLSTLWANANLSPAAKYGLGFVIVGLLYITVGTTVAVIMKGRLEKHSLVPDRTVDEFRKDKEWLKKEL
jgi:uncharacterized membrane protein YqjE